MHKNIFSLFYLNNLLRSLLTYLYVSHSIRVIFTMFIRNFIDINTRNYIFFFWYKNWNKSLHGSKFLMWPNFLCFLSYETLSSILVSHIFLIIYYFEKLKLSKSKKCTALKKLWEFYSIFKLWDFFIDSLQIYIYIIYMHKSFHRILWIPL